MDEMYSDSVYGKFLRGEVLMEWERGVLDGSVLLNLTVLMNR